APRHSPSRSTAGCRRRAAARPSRRCSSASAWRPATRSSSATDSPSSGPGTTRPSSKTATPWSWHGRSRVDSRLYLITPVRDRLGALIEAAVRGGVDIVQVREKSLPDGALLPALAEAREATRRLGVPLVVNDRPDLAVLVEADYVHVGQDDLPVSAARRFGLRVGQSTHTPGELDRSEADYVGVGPVYATPTKEGRPGTGLSFV